MESLHVPSERNAAYFDYPLGVRMIRHTKQERTSKCSGSQATADSEVGELLSQAVYYRRI